MNLLLASFMYYIDIFIIIIIKNLFNHILLHAIFFFNNSVEILLKNAWNFVNFQLLLSWSKLCFLLVSMKCVLNTIFSFNELINCIVYFLFLAWKIFLENEKPQTEGKQVFLFCFTFWKRKMKTINDFPKHT